MEIGKFIMKMPIRYPIRNTHCVTKYRNGGVEIAKIAMAIQEIDFNGSK